jgi:hypothetical protein
MVLLIGRMAALQGIRLCNYLITMRHWSSDKKPYSARDCSDGSFFGLDVYICSVNKMNGCSPFYRRKGAFSG